jgi:hypothetical protein
MERRSRGTGAWASNDHAPCRTRLPTNRVGVRLVSKRPGKVSVFPRYSYSPAKRYFFIVGDAGFEPETPSLGDKARCGGLLGIASSPYLSRFLFPGLLGIAGCCARGGVKVLSKSVRCRGDGEQPYANYRCFTPTLWAKPSSTYAC